MTNDSNTPYAFPLPACTVHTFQWEDGEHDTCYRCGFPATASAFVSEAKRHGVKPSELLGHFQIVGAL